MGEYITNIIEIVKDYLSTLPFEVVVVGIIFALVFIYGLRAGRYKVVSLTLSGYVALILFLWFPFHEKFALDFGLLFDKFIISDMLLLTATMIVVHLLIGEIAEEEYSSRKVRKFVNIGLLSLGFSILFMTSIYLTDSAVLSVDVVSSLDSLFGAVKYQFWLLVTPLIIIFITTR